MSRDVPAGIDADLDSYFIIPVFFVALEFDTDPLYLHTDVGEITTLGQTWLGTGGLGSISEIEETTEAAAPGLKLRLEIATEGAGSIFEELTAQDFYQREARLYFSTKDTITGLLTDDPMEIQRYKMDVPEIVYGPETAFVDLIVESEFIEGEKTNGEMYSKAQLREEHPSDEGFDYIALLAQTKIVWGGKKTARLGGPGQGGGAPDAGNLPFPVSPG